MPISRVMNMPDGSTPVPPVGGGDVNGTLATSILGAQAGGPMNAISLERHQHFQTSALGLVSPQAPLAAEGMGQAIALEEESEDSEELRQEEQVATAEEEPPEPPEAPEEVEEWLAENRAITAPPAPKEPAPKEPRQRPPRHR